GGNSQEPEQPGRHLRAVDQLRLLAAGDHERAFPMTFDLLKELRLLTPAQQGRGGLKWATSPRRPSPDLSEPIRIGERGRSQDEGIDHRKDNRCRSNAEGQRQGGGDGESW